MKKFVVAALIAAVATPAVAADAVAPSKLTVSVSQPLFDKDGKRVGNVYRVASDGSPQLIIDEGRLVTVPATTLTEANGKLTTSLTKRQITASR
jgi:opacity protein-like surface antigen